MAEVRSLAQLQGRFGTVSSRGSVREVQRTGVHDKANEISPLYIVKLETSWKVGTGCRTRITCMCGTIINMGEIWFNEAKVIFNNRLLYSPYTLIVKSDFLSLKC